MDMLQRLISCRIIIIIYYCKNKDAMLRYEVVTNPAT